MKLIAIAGLPAAIRTIGNLSPPCPYTAHTPYFSFGILTIISICVRSAVALLYIKPAVGDIKQKGTNWHAFVSFPSRNKADIRKTKEQ